MDGSKGRIPNWAIKWVNEDVKKYGFYLAFHYFAYDYIFPGLTQEDIQHWRAFDKYAKEHNIPEIPLEV